MIRRDESLDYHSHTKPGKLEIKALKPCITPREMRIAYLPGASFPAMEILKNADEIYKYTSRGNLVGVITNGTAVPGLGDVGPKAAKPMQEGIAVLFKRLADIDVFDIELDTKDPEKIIEAVKLLAPTFGGINIKDIKAPEGLIIYDRLKEELDIPVFHENLYSTAVVTLAGLINALELVNKNFSEIRIVISGAGTVATGIARLLLKMGCERKKLFMYDIKGLIHCGRNDLFEFQKDFCNDDTSRNKLETGLEGADVFIGASAGNIITPQNLLVMNRYPIVFALASPDPEISYEAAKSSRQDIIVSTSVGQFPNAVLDLLSFPYIFRGALDVQAKSITENMLVAAAKSLAELAREEVTEEVVRAYGKDIFNFGPDYLIPKPIDPRILIRESSAVAEQALEDGVTRTTVEIPAYQEKLGTRLGTGRETMREMILRAPRESLKVVFSEGTNETILRACRMLIDEGIAKPVILGSESEIRSTITKLNLDLSGVQIEDPDHSIHFKSYVDEYFRMRQRKGVIRPEAEYRMKKRDYFAAMMVNRGDADVMIGGLSTHYSETLRTIIEIIGPAPGVSRISSHHLLILPKDVVLMADCAVIVEPNAEEMAEIAVLTAGMAKSLGIDPQVALLSYSNFGSVDHPRAEKVRKALTVARTKAPELAIEGEMQLATARDENIRNEYFPFANLKSNANILVFPDLQSANITMQSLQFLGEAVSIGPILMGTRLPAHLIQYRATVEEVVNLTTIAVVEAASGKR